MTQQEIRAALDSIAGEFGGGAPPLSPEVIGAALKSWDQLPSLVQTLLASEAGAPPLEQVLLGFLTGFYFGFLASQRAEGSRALARILDSSPAA
jgi:hypothetical protein